jgi:hypothetical protein
MLPSVIGGPGGCLGSLDDDTRLPEQDRADAVDDLLRLFLSRVCDPPHSGGAGNVRRCVPGGDFKHDDHVG